MTERPPDADLVAGADDAELRELRALAARHAPLELELQAPPPGLWERIEEQVRAESAPPTNLADVRRARRITLAPWLLGAAAALLVVAAIGWSLRGSSDSEVIASTELELLGAAGTGSAELVDADGELELRVATDGLDATDGFVEVWVIDAEVSRLVSLGPLRADGVYVLPGGLDPEEFPIVDVSFEPFDGDPAHSGDSVLRGTLAF